MGDIEGEDDELLGLLSFNGGLDLDTDGIYQSKGFGGEK